MPEAAAFLYLLSASASAQVRELRKTDSRAALLHRRSLQWLIILAVVWPIGFAILGLTLYMLHRHGIV